MSPLSLCFFLALTWSSAWKKSVSLASVCVVSESSQLMLKVITIKQSFSRLTEKCFLDWLLRWLGCCFCRLLLARLLTCFFSRQEREYTVGVVPGRLQSLYTKYSKHWPYTVSYTIDCVCRKCWIMGVWIVCVLAYSYFMFEFYSSFSAAQNGRFCPDT